MRLWEATGYLASAFVVIAFCMKDIVPLRIAAIVSNLAFLAYGIGLGLPPVWMLHAVLLPLNSWRLWQAIPHRAPKWRLRATADDGHRVCPSN